MSSQQGKYLTIAAISEGFYRERGSKFYAYAIPCSSEHEIKEHIARLRKENPQAVHVCSAFRLGSDKKVFRASDDGEPSNSAGPPILGQIQSFDLTNILIAIVRYYGGTNLGVGGLINAYKTASKDALEQATIVECEDELQVRIQFPYEELSPIMKLLKQSTARITAQEVNTQTSIDLNVPISQQQLLEELKKRTILTIV